MEKKILRSLCLISLFLYSNKTYSIEILSCISALTYAFETTKFTSAYYKDKENKKKILYLSAALFFYHYTNQKSYIPIKSIKKIPALLIKISTIHFLEGLFSHYYHKNNTNFPFYRDIDGSSTILHSFSNKREQKEETIEKLKSEINNLKKETSGSQKKQESLEKEINEIKSLETDIIKIKNNIESFNSKKENIASMEKEIDENKIKLDGILNQSIKTNETIKELQINIEKKNQAIKKLEEKYTDIENKIVSFQEARNLLEKTIKENNNVNREEKEKIKNDINDIKELLNTIEKTKKELLDSKENLYISINKLTQKIESSEKQNNEHNEEFKTSIKKTNQTITELKKENADTDEKLGNKINSLEENLEKTKKDFLYSKDTFNELTNKIDLSKKDNEEFKKSLEQIKKNIISDEESFKKEIRILKEIFENKAKIETEQLRAKIKIIEKDNTDMTQKVNQAFEELRNQRASQESFKEKFLQLLLLKSIEQNAEEQKKMMETWNDAIEKQKNNVEHKYSSLKRIMNIESHLLYPSP